MDRTCKVNVLVGHYCDTNHEKTNEVSFGASWRLETAPLATASMINSHLVLVPKKAITAIPNFRSWISLLLPPATCPLPKNLLLLLSNSRAIAATAILVGTPWIARTERSCTTTNCCYQLPAWQYYYYYHMLPHVTHILIIWKLSYKYECWWDPTFLPLIMQTRALISNATATTVMDYYG